MRAEQIKQAVRLTDALDFYGITVNRAGFCSCPFHPEKTPSMRIYKDDSFYCFGCGAHGDVIDLVMRLFGLSFTEAVDKLAADFHLTRKNDARTLHFALETFLRRKERERQQETHKRLQSEYNDSVRWLRVTETATDIAAQFQKDEEDFTDTFATILRQREQARNQADDKLNALCSFEIGLYASSNK